MSDPATPEKKARPENLLFHSRIEICRILKVLAQEQSPLSAEIMSGSPFASHLLSVNSDSGHFAVAYSPHKLINAMVMNSPTVEFTATDRQGMHYSFVATDPEEALSNGLPAIQFALPKSLLLHNRREHSRLPVPAEISLRCIADEEGFIPFESHITDVSHDGFGCLIYDAEVILETGALLHGSRVILPNGDAVVADLELCYAAPTTLPDGKLANRAGFRFVQKSDGLAKLIHMYIQDLDKK